MTPEEQKVIIKEALHVWLDEKYAQFGKYSLHGAIAMMLAALVFLFFTQHGWTPPK